MIRGRAGGEGRENMQAAGRGQPGDARRKERTNIGLKHLVNHSWVFFIKFHMIIFSESRNEQPSSSSSFSVPFSSRHSDYSMCLELKSPYMSISQMPPRSFPHVAFETVPMLVSSFQCICKLYWNKITSSKVKKNQKNSHTHKHIIFSC